MLSKWRYKRDLSNIDKYEKDGDLRSAMLTLEQLNRLHPSNAGVRRRLAGFYERAGQVESVVIWREAIELAPDNPESRLGLARSAIRFGDLPTARQALAGLVSLGTHRAEYHRLRAGLAYLEKDVTAQEENLAALAAIEPTDQRVRLNLAVLWMQMPHAPKAAEARTILQELARGNLARIRAVVELLSDVARRWPNPAPERDEALKTLAAQLTPARGPMLELPSQVDHIDRLIAYAMSQPSPTAEDAISLANWMSLNGHTAAALQWIDALPETVTRSPVVQTAMTEFAIRAKDWTRLQQLLQAGAWGAVPAGVVEQAFRAQRNSREEARTGAGLGWSTALEAAKPSPAALRLLLRLAEVWAWPAEYRQVLQAIARTLPREYWAWRQLLSHAIVQGDAEQLWQVYQEWRRAVPGDPMIQVEAAIMGLLLGRRPVPDAGETAEYVRQLPAHAGAAVAHALALWRAKRAAEAVAVLDALSVTEYAEPRYALAYGLVLSEMNRAAESVKFLDRAAADRLLPEEQALLRAARERNEGRPPLPR
jgi:thioredoxin-like negative regulator of GroEL